MTEDQAQTYESREEIIQPSQQNGPVPDTLEDRRRRDREAVTVTPGRGLSPDTYGSYITVAQGICKPDNIMLKQELRSNVAVVIGLLDIAMRANLSVYMLAMHAYVIKGVLCFDAQAFHALARPFLDGGLKGEYLGEGDGRSLVVRGRLKGDPFEYDHQSPPLKQLHPGHVSKTYNDEVVVQVKGSQLWDRKPDVQLWYDTTRDWIRMHCPEATLGVYTREEVESDDFKDVTPRPSLGQRLAASERPAMPEGFRHEAVVGEIEQAALNDQVEKGLSEMSIGPSVSMHGAEADPRSDQYDPGPNRPRKAASRRKAPPKPKKPPEPKTRRRPPQPREKAPPPKPRKAAPKPEAAEEIGEQARVYVAQAEQWIAEAKDAADAEMRWDNEYDDRNKFDVPVSERNRLRAMLEERVERLRAAGAEE